MNKPKTVVVVKTPTSKTEYSDVVDITLSPDIENATSFVVTTTTDEDTYEDIEDYEITIKFKA